MKRFLVLPMILSFIGTLFCPIYYFETLLAQWPAYTFPFAITLREKVLFYLLPVALYGAMIGAFVGLGMGLWDLLRNRTNQSATTRVIANLFWCSCYALTLILANRVFAQIALLFNNSNSAGSIRSGIMLFWWLGTLLLNFTAIIWAAIRSITTNDILTPRVLRDKLRERARLN